MSKLKQTAAVGHNITLNRMLRQEVDQMQMTQAGGSVIGMV